MKNIDFFGDGAQFDHAGIAVKSIDQLMAIEKTEDPLQRVSVAFIKIHGFPIELIEPLNESSPVMGILEKGVSLYHLCFNVPNLENALQAAAKNGFSCFSKPKEATAFGNKKIAWVFSRNYGIFELLEK